MTMHYLVYLPSLKVMFVSQIKEECDERHREIGRDYDEDYKVMKDLDFLKLVGEVTVHARRNK